VTVYFEKGRNRWRYDFQFRGKRYVGECLDERGRSATHRSVAISYELKIRETLPRRGTVLTGNERGWVYFIATQDRSHVKVGWATSVRHRLNGLQTAHHQKLIVLAKFRGTVTDERDLHRALKKHRVRGEWFVCSDEVMELVDRISNKAQAPDRLREKGLLSGKESPTNSTSPVLTMT
jgi:hypothetical protein